MRELQHLLLAWELLGDSRRAAFQEAAARYVEFYLNHMRTEETELLPVAQKHLSEADWVQLNAAFATHADDPLVSGDHDPVYDRLFTRMRGLGRRLGPVLYQLPPGWKADADRFAQFLGGLPRARHVVEFRDPSWYVPEILALMERHHVALCLHDMQGSATVRERVGPFVYVRFHGSTLKYGGGYPEDRLRGWAEWLNVQRDAGCDVYAYFNNDVGGHAPRDAVTLRRVLEE